MAKTILGMLPESRIYVEPFGGSGSLMWKKKAAPIEVYNDIDGDLVNLFRAIQSPERCALLEHRLTYTLHSREEFVRALQILKDTSSSADDRAWAFFVGQNQGFSGIDSRKATRGTWARAKHSYNGMSMKTSGWLTKTAMFKQWHDRIKRVTIENDDALNVIKYWDSENTVFYLDPPYVNETRRSGEYSHEIDDNYHHKLIELLLTISGDAVLSGYPHPIYDALEKAGWQIYEKKVICRIDSNQHIPNGVDRNRTEKLWIKIRNGKGVNLTMF